MSETKEETYEEIMNKAVALSIEINAFIASKDVSVSVGFIAIKVVDNIHRERRPDLHKEVEASVSITKKKAPSKQIKEMTDERNTI